MNPKIICETNDYYVISKPAGMATEPPSKELTLRDWLVEHGQIDRDDWGPDDRYGVVHRLDSDTSGVLIWAKNPAAQNRLRLLWQSRTVKKTYLALVVGETPAQGVIELPLMRDNKKDRQITAIFPSPKARPAITNYRRIAVGNIGGSGVSLVEAQPITGRTHQIRVHLKSIGHPIIADSLYGEKEGKALAKQIGLERQFLHASTIELEGATYSDQIPDDLRLALTKSSVNFLG